MLPRFFLFCLVLCMAPAQALTTAQARAIAAGETDSRIAALNQAAAQAEPDLAAFVQSLLDDAVKLTPEQLLRVSGSSVTDAITGQVASLPEGAEDVVNNNRMRGALQAALAALQLLSPDLVARRAAVAQMSQQTLDAGQLPLLSRALAAETDAGLQSSLALMRAALLIEAPEATSRLGAARQLAQASDPTVKSLLIARIAVEPDIAVRSALAQALSALERRLAWGERLGLLFTGISLASILLLAALGLTDGAKLSLYLLPTGEAAPFTSPGLA